MNEYVLSGCSGFVFGLVCWFAIFKLIAVFRMFASGIEDAFRND